MENGFYTCREYKILLYEKKGDTSFAVVANDQFPNNCAVLTGESAERLILAFAECLDIIREKEGS